VVADQIGSHLRQTIIVPVGPVGSGGKSSTHRVHAGERDKTHRKKWRVITSALMNRRQ
jgi:hypothetical protein